jgi:hypothetical protein
MNGESPKSEEFGYTPPLRRNLRGCVAIKAVRFGLT